jgi:hypothetical protein
MGNSHKLAGYEFEIESSNSEFYLEIKDVADISGEILL